MPKPVIVTACQMPNTPPVGSVATAIRPESAMSIGSNSMLPPCSVISLALVSASSVAR